DDAVKRHGVAREPPREHIDTRLRPREADQISAAAAPFGGIDVHSFVARLRQAGNRLAVPVERPCEHRLAERKLIGLDAGRPGIPYVPRLAVAVHLAFHQLALYTLGNSGREQLTGQDLVVVRVPVLL